MMSFEYVYTPVMESGLFNIRDIKDYQYFIRLLNDDILTGDKADIDVEKPKIMSPALRIFRRMVKMFVDQLYLIWYADFLD